MRLRLLISISLLLIGCNESANTPSGVDMYMVGSHSLYIPDPYIVDAGNGQSALLHALNPGDIPATDSNREHDTSKNPELVRILMTDISQQQESFTPEKKLLRRIKDNNFQAATNEHGLVHMKPSNPSTDGEDEIWVESDQRDSLSFIECDKSETVSIPHCRHYFHDENFKYEVTYRAGHLPEWKNIRSRISQLVGSFSTRETSEKFYAERLVDVKNRSEVAKN